MIILQQGKHMEVSAALSQQHHWQLLKFAAISSYWLRKVLGSSMIVALDK